MTGANPNDPLAAADPAMAALIDREQQRRRRGLPLLAAESVATPAVRAAVGSVLADKYAEGYPGRRYHAGCEVVDEVEELALARARDLFGADYANVQPLSWVLANLAVLAAFAQPGDPLLSLSLRHGGHQTHGSRANSSGRWFTVVNYGVREDTEQIDYEKMHELAMIHRPRILVAGGTSYTRTWDYARLRAIADEAGCILWVDAAHLAGLVAGGVLESPVPYADVVTVATNKVIRGPRGGLLLAREEHGGVLDRAVFPFLQGAPPMHAIGAKAVTFAETATPGYRDYASSVADSARALASELADRGLRPVAGGTDTHLGIVEVTALGITGREAAVRLAASGIYVDKAVTPFDPAPVAQGSAIRFGTAAAVAEGLTSADAPAVADLMVAAMRTPADDHARHEALAQQVAALGAR
ncbi:serine hydroxymethyltransferase [Gordonia sp. (in: high G+C Gram-positive bacteria)]|uniref:serine hydroxymethyltransferase n=1 Tax=Gordonia sp. (in: high G+C Gram-positive bacteria) TaxID=84139 RepID=UPI0035284D73